MPDGGLVLSAQHQAALQYAAAGCPVFPCQANGKRPATPNGFKNRTVDRAKINDWWSQNPNFNIAVVPADLDLCVIDLDPKHGGIENWQALTHDRPIPATYTVATPSGGMHLYFRGSLPGTVGKLVEGVDTRGILSYVLAVGSAIDGKPYSLTEGVKECAELPAWVSQTIMAPRYGDQATREFVERNQKVPVPEDELVAILRHVDPDCGYDDWYRLIGAIRATRLADVAEDATDARLLDIAKAWSRGDYWSLAATRWTGDDDTERKFWAMPPKPGGSTFGTLYHAAKAAGYDKPPPRLSDAELFAGVRLDIHSDAGVLDPAARKWAFTRPSDDARQAPLAYWDDIRGVQGKGMLPRVTGGCAVIVWGKKSSHKSGLLIKECLDAALMKGAKVLYLACEGAHGIRTSRLPAACRQRGIGIEALDNLWRTFPASPGLMNNAEIDELIARCREEGFEPDIIVIDTLTRAVAGFDINAPATGAGLILGMERLGAAFDATVVAVTHPGKDSDKGAIGSSLIESLAFAIWRVALDGEAVFVEMQKMKDGPAEFSVPFKVMWLLDGSPAPVKCGTPVVVEVAPGEHLARAGQSDEVHVSEELVRGVLIRRQCYGAHAALAEPHLADHLAGEAPDEAENEARREWELRRHRIAHGLRSARSRRDWTKRLSAEQVLASGQKPVWTWFLPEPV